MKSYLFPVVVEPDEDVWRAYVPDLESRGAATWGHTREEALRNIQDAAEAYVADMLEAGESIPLERGRIDVIESPAVAVTI